MTIISTKRQQKTQSVQYMAQVRQGEVNSELYIPHIIPYKNYLVLTRKAINDPNC